MISINQKNAFNFNLENKKSHRRSIMNTSIDQINRSRHRQGESGGIASIHSEMEKKKLSGFFMEPVKDSGIQEKKNDVDT